MSAPFVTWTVQGAPDLWLGHHSGHIVCRAHADEYAAGYYEPLSRDEIFDFEFDMGQRISTIADCAELHERPAS